MKYSHKLSDAVHILAYIGICNGGDLSSNTIARSVESNPSLVRRLMSTLVKADLLISQPGVSAPKLAKAAAEITLLDIYNAVEEPVLLHVDRQTNPDCIIGSNIQDTLDMVYGDVQQVAEQKMNSITLAFIIADILKRQGDTPGADSNWQIAE